uniref:Uncharacterized protein n=1 Tax=Nelumbo nucifera TaxID=4432 RepID=A0A822XJC4_NELNU|nr:TPA_asm: hypothetical protein HUJ06_021266 [Nelumbo nucifera]
MRASVVLIILFSIMLQLAATRPLGSDDEWLKKEDIVIQLQSLQRGPVPPSRPSCNTNLGGRPCPPP